MPKINDEMKKLLDGSMWVFATANAHSEPNAVPIHFKKVIGENQLLLIDNYMNKSKANILENKQVSISVWKETLGYQFKGKASYITSGPLVDEGAKLIPLGFFPKDEKHPRGVVLVDVDAIYATSPGPDAGCRLL